MPLPHRKHLGHAAPDWVTPGEVYFITINCKTRGCDQLIAGENPAFLLESAQKLQAQNQWWAHLFLLMPDHLHGLITFGPNVKMAELIARFKSFQARKLGIEWQDGFFDHRIRDDREFELKADYIRANPVRAGLCEINGDWANVIEHKA